MDIAAYFLIRPGQAEALMAALGTAVAFWFVGGLLAGDRRFAAIDAFVGWGAVTGIMTLSGVIFPTPFRVVTYLFWATVPLAVFLLWRHGRRDDAVHADVGLLIKVLVLALPLLIPVAAMQASQWDEFSQWLPNAGYIYRYDGFPGPGLPQSPSVYPAYPYAGPLFGYLVSTLSGFFVENAIALGNLLLLLIFAPVYLHAIRDGLKAGDHRFRGWGSAAFGIMGVTILSTTFVQKLVFTAYADTSTAVALGVLGILLWKILDELSKGGEGGDDVRILAWQFALVCALFINLKQTNVVLLVFLLAASGLVIIRDRDIRVADFLRLLPIMLLAPAAVYFAWRYHVSMYLVAGEFHLMPFESWHTDKALQILGRMALIASEKGTYFGMMAALAMYAAWALLRFRGGFDRLAFLTGATFVGYNLFLWFTYVAAFGDYEGPRAASFWRYNTQLGILGCTTAARGAAILWRRYGGAWAGDHPRVTRVLSTMAIFLVLAAPVALIKKIRFDVRPQKEHIRMVGRELGRTLPEGAKLAVIDPAGQGFADMVIRYELLSGTGAGRHLALAYRFDVRGKSEKETFRKMAKAGITHVWVHQVLPGVPERFGLSLKPAASYLLKMTPQGWERVKSWAYPGYTDPYSLPD